MANYAPLDLVAATTMVRDKVRTIAHPNICMMMPCFRANLPHRSDSAVVDRLDARSWVRIPGQAWMASTAEGSCESTALHYVCARVTWTCHLAGLVAGDHYYG